MFIAVSIILYKDFTVLKSTCLVNHSDQHTALFDPNSCLHLESKHLLENHAAENLRENGFRENIELVPFFLWLQAGQQERSFEYMFELATWSAENLQLFKQLLQVVFTPRLLRCLLVEELNLGLEQFDLGLRIHSSHVYFEQVQEDLIRHAKTRKQLDNLSVEEALTVGGTPDHIERILFVVVFLHALAEAYLLVGLQVGVEHEHAFAASYANLVR